MEGLFGEGADAAQEAEGGALAADDAAEVAGVDAEGAGGGLDGPALAVEPCHIGLKFLRLTGHCGIDFFCVARSGIAGNFPKVLFHT